MPKTKLIKINYWNNSFSPMIVCNECGYKSRSNTGMKLHRKIKHNKDENFSNSPIVFLCGGCNIKKSECKCKK